MTSAANPPIATFKDILDAMEQRPELLEAMRQHIVGQELMQLPGVVRELAQDLREFITAANARFERIESDIADLKAGQARMQADIVELKANQAQMQADIADLKANQAQMQADIAELKANQAQMQADIAELKANQAQMQADIAELKAGQARLESDVAELKAGQARLESDVAELKAGQARLESDVAELKAGQARLESDVAELKSEQSSMRGTLGRLLGSDYERKATNRIIRLAMRRLRMPNPVVIHASALPDKTGIYRMVDQAVIDGRITGEQGDDLDEADIILHDRGANLYALVEVSVTLDADDAIWARRRADILASAAQAPVTAAVVGSQALDECQAAARPLNVSILLLPD